ncbi:MAG: aminodeoxychorismate/anthranilate synthase component II [Deltaproteobacteria bacterium]|nr:aminodeoxychorismate/anthranilate synthase component II [Deltaproteobacteria bacterium]
MTLKKLFVLDNYDSFTYNLVQLFMPFNLDITVCRNDKTSVSYVEKIKPDYVIISPGPKYPQNAGISVALIKKLAKKTPVLGVCLGMQSINEAFGGKTVKAPVPVHGKTSLIYHNGSRLFKNIKTSFNAARYHSLTAQLSPASPLKTTAKTEDGIIMGIEYPNHNIYGVQFHPESFLTEYGGIIAENFLNISKH